jgi:DNA-binding Lrp family transcriptional regulator
VGLKSGRSKMVEAYVLAKIEMGKEVEVLNGLKGIHGLNRASLTYGIYDLCIEVQLETMEDLDILVFNEIRRIRGIKETVTLVVSKT